MGQKIEERFTVRAPVEEVWAYLVDPRRVVTCLPGAELTEVVDERTFHGAVKVKVGPVTVAYKGKVILEEVDAAARRVRMSGEGRESTGTGSARMSMESRLTRTPSGEVEVLVISDVEVVGRLVQLGRGMIEQVSHQLFARFAGCVKATLEAEAASPGAAPQVGAVPLPVAQPVKIVPLVLGAFWAVLLALFRRLAGRK